ncbi:MAG TPA: CcdC protein domain-containing protein [Bacillales bacterium]|nr:CcdC protein domain-containing protein [Bacillales bacterium]
MNQHFYIYIVIGALILFNIFRRVSKSFGWQQMNQGKMIIRIALYSIVGILFFIQGGIHLISLISDAVGILIGTLLAYYSSKKTNFEKREEHWYFCPNKWFGGVVVVLFFGRLLYRFYEMYTLGVFSGTKGGMQNLNASFGPSWTAGLILIMFAYYFVYYLALIRKQKQLQCA